MLEVRLRAEGVAFRHAHTAATGLLLARDLQPDLVLLEADLADRSGFDVCLDLKGDDRTADIPVVFLTARSEVGDKVRGLDLGALDFVTKPFHAGELLARIRAALRTKRYQDLLRSQARIDALTGLWNRSIFDERLDDEVRAAVRYGRAISLLMIDIDQFKEINDTSGHLTGDRVLSAVGDLLHRVTRGTDAACRYGGDEFAIIAPDTSRAGAIALAGRLRDELCKVFVGPEHTGVTASIGIVATEHFPDNAEITPRTLLCLADDALYEAKRRGRNQAVVAASKAVYVVALSSAPSCP